MRSPTSADAGQPSSSTRDPSVAAGPDRPGNTRSNVQGEPAPRTPSEHDESADSGTSPPRDVMQRAHDDVASGKTETDRGEVTDEVYRRTLKTPPPEAGKNPP